MIPTTPAECDAFLADVSALILAAMNTGRRIAPPDSQLTPEQQEQVASHYRAARIARAVEAVAEAGALLAELQLHAKVQRFPDGEPIDPRALDPAQQFCAHGVSLADDCDQCAKGETSPPAPTVADDADEGGGTSDNADAAGAFRRGLRGN